MGFSILFLFVNSIMQIFVQLLSSDIYIKMKIIYEIRLGLLVYLFDGGLFFETNMLCYYK